jgi:hypothetical protein
MTGMKHGAAAGAATREHEAIDEFEELGAGVAIRGEGRVAFEDERREESIACGEPLADQCLGDGLGLMAMDRDRIKPTCDLRRVGVRS